MRKNERVFVEVELDEEIIGSVALRLREGGAIGGENGEKIGERVIHFSCTVDGTDEGEAKVGGCFTVIEVR